MAARLVGGTGLDSFHDHFASYSWARPNCCIPKGSLRHVASSDAKSVVLERQNYGNHAAPNTSALSTSLLTLLSFIPGSMLRSLYNFEVLPPHSMLCSPFSDVVIIV